MNFNYINETCFSSLYSHFTTAQGLCNVAIETVVLGYAAFLVYQLVCMVNHNRKVNPIVVAAAVVATTVIGVGACAAMTLGAAKIKKAAAVTTTEVAPEATPEVVTEVTTEVKTSVEIDTQFAQAMGMEYDDVFGAPLTWMEDAETETLEYNFAPALAWMEETISTEVVKVVESVETVNFAKLTVKELKAIAKAQGLKGYSKLPKAQLVALLK